MDTMGCPTQDSDIYLKAHLDIRMVDNPMENMKDTPPYSEGRVMENMESDLLRLGANLPVQSDVLENNLPVQSDVLEANLPVQSDVLEDRGSGYNFGVKWTYCNGNTKRYKGLGILTKK